VLQTYDVTWLYLIPNCLDRETNNAFHFAKVENWALLPYILDNDLLLKKADIYLGVRINCSNNDWLVDRECER